MFLLCHFKLICLCYNQISTSKCYQMYHHINLLRLYKITYRHCDKVMASLSISEDHKSISIACSFLILFRVSIVMAVNTK